MHLEQPSGTEPPLLYVVAVLNPPSGGRGRSGQLRRPFILPASSSLSGSRAATSWTAHRPVRGHPNKKRANECTSPYAAVL